MNNLVTSGLNSTERFIKIYRLNQKITYLTLLFYQFVYLNSLTKQAKEKEEIILSYLENDCGIRFVTIMSHDNIKKVYTLRRFRFEMDVYQKINENFDDNGLIVIDDSLVKSFNKVYEEEIEWKVIKSN